MRCHQLFFTLVSDSAHKYPKEESQRSPCALLATRTGFYNKCNYKVNFYKTKPPFLALGMWQYQREIGWFTSQHSGRKCLVWSGQDRSQTTFRMALWCWIGASPLTLPTQWCSVDTGSNNPSHCFLH